MNRIKGQMQKRMYCFLQINLEKNTNPESYCGKCGGWQGGATPQAVCPPPIRTSSEEQYQN